MDPSDTPIAKDSLSEAEVDDIPDESVDGDTDLEGDPIEHEERVKRRAAARAKGIMNAQRKKAADFDKQVMAERGDIVQEDDDAENLRTCGLNVALALYVNSWLI